MAPAAADRSGASPCPADDRTEEHVMSRLANTGVGKRLGLSFLLVTLLIAAAVGVGQWQIGKQQDLNTRMNHLEQLEDDIQTFAYHVADITGWQGLVVA